MSLDPSIPRSKPALWLTLIVVLGAVLRFYHLDFQSLGVDEIASMNGTDPELSLSAVVTYSKADQPPAFFLMLHGWFQLLAVSDYNGRLLALLLGLAGIVAMYFFGKEVKNERAGLIASLITTLSYIHIYFSQEVRFYTLLFLFSTLSYLFFIRAARYEKTRDFVLYTLFTSAVIYTHYFGLVLLASQGLLFIILLAMFRSTTRAKVSAILSGIFILLLISPWLPVFFSDIGIATFWIPMESFLFPLRYFYVYFKDIPSCIVFGTLILFYMVQLYRRRKTNSLERSDVILFGGIFLSFLIPLIYSILRTPMLQVRYTMIALPPLIVIISLAFLELNVSARRGLLAAVLCTSLFSLVVVEGYYTKRIKEDWRSMIRYVVTTAKPTDRFVSRYEWYCNYYFKVMGSPIRSITPEELTRLGEKPETVWWLEGFDFGGTPEPVLVELVEKGYTLEKSSEFYRTRASRYQRP